MIVHRMYESYAACIQRGNGTQHVNGFVLVKILRQCPLQFSAQVASPVFRLYHPDVQVS